MWLEQVHKELAQAAGLIALMLVRRTMRKSQLLGIASTLDRLSSEIKRRLAD